MGTDAADALASFVERDGGAVLGAYRDPFGGKPLLIVSLPIDRVEPTPYQRDPSDPHVKRLMTVIETLDRFLDPQTVRFEGYRPGTIVVRTSERRLYLVVDDGRALRYPVGVGKKGKAWSGTRVVDGKYRNPAWTPPAIVRRDKPNLPRLIPGGSPANPRSASGRRRSTSTWPWTR